MGGVPKINVFLINYATILGCVRFGGFPWLSVAEKGKRMSAGRSPFGSFFLCLHVRLRACMCAFEDLFSLNERALDHMPNVDKPDSRPRGIRTLVTHSH